MRTPLPMPAIATCLCAALVAPPGFAQGRDIEATATEAGAQVAATQAADAATKQPKSAFGKAMAVMIAAAQARDRQAASPQAGGGHGEGAAARKPAARKPDVREAAPRPDLTLAVQATPQGD